MWMSQRVSVALLLAFLSCNLGNFKGARGLTIQVVDVDGGIVRNEFSDSSAAFHERSFHVPTKKSEAIKGSLVYPNPRNACSLVEAFPNETNKTFIAYIEEYMNCPTVVEVNLRKAGFAAMIAYSKVSGAYLWKDSESLPQALLLDKEFAKYLVDHVILETNTSSLIMWDNSLAKLEQLFIIFGVILLVAVTLSICVFCTSLICRTAMTKWRNRGLSIWQVRALPKRKFRKAKESTDTCSICLEEFKEGETVRVLPCDHVFHPKCVDEWLRKWNRTCPLCKCHIKRKTGGRGQPSAITEENETSLLVSQERVSLLESGNHTDGVGHDRRYGSTGATSALQGGQHKRGDSDTSSTSNGGGTHRNQVTAAEMELSTESHPQDEGSSPVQSVYHTPLHSDQEPELSPSASFVTAYSSGRATSEQV